MSLYGQDFDPTRGCAFMCMALYLVVEIGLLSGT